MTTLRISTTALLCCSLIMACADDEPGMEGLEAGDTGMAETAGTSGGETGETGDESMDPPALGLCDAEPPEGATLAPELPTYGGPGSCPVLETGADTLNVMETDHGPREFYLVTPSDPQPDEQFPILFMYHWLGGTAQTFISRAEAQQAVDHYRMIAIVPEGRDASTGVPLRWPFSVGDDDARQDEEFAFHDDLIACVAEQFAVNKECISSTGVSAGAMFTAMLASRHGDHLSSFISLSGGTGTGELIVQPWITAPRAMPAMILWGGPTDLCLGVDFDVNSKRLEDELEAEGHFVMECVHNCAHSIPPFEPVNGLPVVASIAEFVLDHPYWLETNTSPYLDFEAVTGALPPSFPDWCAIGADSATIREGECGPSEC